MIQMIHDVTDVTITTRWAKNEGDNEKTYPVIDIDFERVFLDHQTGRKITSNESITLFTHYTEKAELRLKNIHGYNPSYTRAKGCPQDMVLTLKAPDLHDVRLPEEQIEEEKELAN